MHVSPAHFESPRSFISSTMTTTTQGPVTGKPTPAKLNLAEPEGTKNRKHYDSCTHRIRCIDCHTKGNQISTPSSASYLHVEPILIHHVMKCEMLIPAHDWGLCRLVYLLHKPYWELGLWPVASHIDPSGDYTETCEIFQCAMNPRLDIAQNRDKKVQPGTMRTCLKWTTMS